MALANGKSLVKCREITLHTKTAIYIAEQFTNVRLFLNHIYILILNFSIVCKSMYFIFV